MTKGGGPDWISVLIWLNEFLAFTSLLNSSSSLKNKKFKQLVIIELEHLSNPVSKQRLWMLGFPSRWPHAYIMSMTADHQTHFLNKLWHGIANTENLQRYSVFG